jgi:hypothetical protein
MENLNWGYIQLGLFALAFSGLQIWWISSVFRRRDMERPLSDGEFRRSLERNQSSKQIQKPVDFIALKACSTRRHK